MSRIIHIAGMATQVGNVQRQRCAWCGESLIDDDLELMMSPADSEPRPKQWYWEPNSLVLVEVNGDMRATSVAQPLADGRLPPGSCVYPGGHPPLRIVES